jgi:nucleotide-binding universal stress UspA family protein
MAIKPIVVGTDGSDRSLHAVEWAANEAALHDAPLRIVSAIALPSHLGTASTSHVVTTALTTTAEKALDDAADLADLVVPGLAVDTALLVGKPARVLADAAAGAAMLVVGSQGAGSLTAVGSVSRHLATHPPCPVVIERAETPQAHGQVVVGVRELEDSAATLAFAFQEAALRRAHLLAVHAWFWFRPAINPAEAGRPVIDPHQVSSAALIRLHQLLAPWQEKYPDVEVGEQIVHAHPGRALAAASASADLVVLGSHGGQGRVDPGSGSVTHAVLNHARCPVFIVPASEQGADFVKPTLLLVSAAAAGTGPAAGPG